MVLVIPSFLYHIIHYFKLLVIAFPKELSFTSFIFIVVYMSFQNSGLLSFLVMEFYGFLLVDNPLSELSRNPFEPVQFRNTLSYILLLLVLPAFPHTFCGLLWFPWFSLTMEIAIAMLVFIAFPEVFQREAKGARQYLRLSLRQHRDLCCLDPWKLWWLNPLLGLLIAGFPLVSRAMEMIDVPAMRQSSSCPWVSLTGTRSL